MSAQKIFKFLKISTDLSFSDFVFFMISKKNIIISFHFYFIVSIIIIFILVLFLHLVTFPPFEHIMVKWYLQTFFLSLSVYFMSILYTSLRI